MASVFVPVLYILVVFGGLFIFSYFYRKSAAAKSFEPYFPSHSERNAYITLLGKDPPASDCLLKSALLRRAIADVGRVVRLREDKPALQNLLQKGSVGDDLWNSLLAAEKELEAEIMEVVTEANTFVEGWGQVIFQTANEMVANEKMRSIFEQSAELRLEKEQKYKVNLQSASRAPSPAPAVKRTSAVPLPSISSTNGPTPAPGAGASNVASNGERPSSPSHPNAASKTSGKKGKKRK